jgi:hypothetical protein
MALEREQLERLRALRLWHWKQAMSWREDEQSETDVAVKAACEAQVGFHIKFVQTLNDFFPEPGDTAERDNGA